MNPLNIRVAHAKAEIAILAGRDEGLDALWETLEDAFALGKQQYHAGEESMPLLFVGAQDLQDRWESGQDFAYQCEETERCYLCKEAQGDPCMIHG
ncbi:hypothetical protein ABQW72_00410 [Xanthomonas hortorum pv. pelargonii]|uniref:hypothetical protein n=1 Tax=Xanthomonas hortorum TaxID=56454 RepID=UPI0021C6CC5C|nr:hypothetical protein [Xanthomonas hortorum]MCU1709516.1 hypothetical protein [Xanthomonas hortorum pv. pelargonii]WCI07308.1 hypothetical protein PML25_22180 [Xanthomonas hortorum pv. pelargonii]WOB32957.1 hypothetical protein NYR98_22525 [Xanthomonas hortorum pv. pelargonii]